MPFPSEGEKLDPCRPYPCISAASEARFLPPDFRLPVGRQVSRTIQEQELVGHGDMSTTMIYAHVLNRGGRGVGSPADRL